MRQNRTNPILILSAVAVAAHALIVSPVLAGSLDVNAGAAFSGNFGLEVTPGSACGSPETVELDSQVVVADIQACSFIRATDTLVNGDVDFTAGISVALGNGFETAAGASFSVGTDPTLTRLAFVTDNSPQDEVSYFAGFRLRLDDLTFGATDELVHFGGFSSDGARWFEVRLKRNQAMAEDRLVLAAREDDGGFVETPFGEEVMLPAGYNLIEIDWLAGAGTGQLLVLLNGVPFGGLTNLDNDTGRIGRVSWGVIDGEVAATTGNLDIDDFSSTQ